MGFPFGSSSGQSSRSTPGTTGHASPHSVTSMAALDEVSSVSFCGTI
jgi:hypothetical protein